MIARSLRSARLGGLVKYLFGPGRAEEHSNQRIVAATNSPDLVGKSALVRRTSEPTVFSTRSASL